MWEGPTVPGVLDGDIHGEVPGEMEKRTAGVREVSLNLTWLEMGAAVLSSTAFIGLSLPSHPELCLCSHPLHPPPLQNLPCTLA